MKVQFNIQEPELSVRDTITGANAEDVVGAVKSQVSARLPFAMRLFVGGMSNLAFAQEVVRRFNAARKTNHPIPASCQEFLKLAEVQGFAIVLEP